MPKFTRYITNSAINRPCNLILEELQHNANELAIELETHTAQLNEEQKTLFDNVTSRLKNPQLG